MLVQERHYYPFGQELLSLGYTNGTHYGYRYRYQGQYAERDAETGWDSFELRAYDSQTGRWLMPDPYGQYWSPYVGMGNNPVNQVDPDGGWSGGNGGLWAGIKGFFSKTTGILSKGIHDGHKIAEITVTVAQVAETGAGVGAQVAARSAVSLAKIGITSYAGGYRPMAMLRQAEVNWMDRWKNTPVLNIGYEIADGVSLTAQTFNPFNQYDTHLNGELAVGMEQADGLASTLGLALPVKGVRAAAGPLRNWVRIGTSRHQGIEYFSIRWGAGRQKYLQEINSTTLRNFNQKFRKFGGGHLDLWKK